jgi:hypothetical protein
MGQQGSGSGHHAHLEADGGAGAKSSVILFQVSAAGKVLFLGKATASGSDGSGCRGWPRTTDTGALPAASDLDTNDGEAGVDGARVETVVTPGSGIVRFGMRGPSLGDDVSFFRIK